jgi:DNA-binding NarL/FixJ family response regulator
MKLLVIDNADAVRPRLADALGEIDGVQVSSCAPRAGKVLQTVAELKPDVVVMDITMMEGSLDLVRSIKAIPHPPVVISLSSTSSIKYRAASHNAGAEYFFNKDDELGRMLEAVSDLQKELPC